MRINLFRTAGRRLFVAAALVAAAATSFSDTAWAEWPERPITVVIMYSAGGGTDRNIRTLVEEIKKDTGWSINVINKPGAVGGVATNFVLNQPADGYTWLGAANYNKFVRVMGHSDSKAWEDWQYMQAAVSLASWSVRPDSPFKTFDDVVKAAKANPGKITISTSGHGGLWHELAAIVGQAAGIELKYVPYKGGAPATKAGLSGETDIAGGGVHEHIKFIEAGQLRNLQQTGTEDIKLPNGTVLPSIANFLPELKSQLPFSGIYNIAVRRATPDEAKAKIEAAFKKAVESDTYQTMLKSRYFKQDVRTGKAADMRAAQVEAITATTFQKLDIKGAIPPEKLGLPKPSEFDAWWKKQMAM